MATTPVYFWPYQSLTDPPNGASLGADLALAVEATVQANAASAASALTTATARMGCSLRRVAAQSLPDNTPTLVSWDTEDADTSHNLFPVFGTDVNIPAGGGVFVITLNIDLPTVPTGTSFITPRVNGVNIGGFPFIPNGGNATATVMRPLNGGDVITASVTADTVAGTTMTGNLYVYRVGL